MMLAALLISSASGRAESADPILPKLQRLAQQNNAEAIYDLGMMYQTGTGVEQDHSKAFAEFQRAASLGDPLAAYKVGCYFDGQDSEVVRPDQASALKYKLIAATAGYALAEQDVAIIYAGKGNGAEAVVWAEKSAAQGWPGGLVTAASIYNVAVGPPHDAAKVAAYFSLFLARIEQSPQQRQWLEAFRAKLSAADRARADDLVSHYRPTPTALTMKGLSGQRAAEALVAGSR